MKRLRAILIFAFGISLLAIACGDDDEDAEASCVSLCEEAVSRDCNTFDLGQGSCSADCALANEIAIAGGCEAERDARISCESAQDDICDPGCSTEDQAFTSCGLAYCQSNPTDESCMALVGVN